MTHDHTYPALSIDPSYKALTWEQSLEKLGNDDLDLANVTVETSGIIETLNNPPVRRVCYNTHNDTRGKLTNAIAARKYIRAGKATITLEAAGQHFTYRIGVSKDGNAHFVSVLNGPDNTSNYQYIGYINARDVFWPGRKTPRPGDISKDAPSVRWFAKAWNCLSTGSIPDRLTIWHESSCGRCGRKLTVPASVSQGYGPECAGKVGL